MKKHPSMRGWFAYEVAQHMKNNDDIYVVTADLGYGMWDHVKINYPDRFINTGAAEQAAMGLCVGLALAGKIPFFYSITNFALYRPFETIRNYISHEQIPVQIIGAGRNKDYAHDGISHWSEDYLQVLNALPGLVAHIPQTKEQMPSLVGELIDKRLPSFISLRR